MEPEQSDDPDDDPAPLPQRQWRQKRVDPPKRGPLEIAALVIGICLAVVLGVFGLAGLAIAVLFSTGFARFGTNK